MPNNEAPTTHRSTHCLAPGAVCFGWDTVASRGRWTGNPPIDGIHTIYALLLLLLMYLHAGDRWGLGRWWNAPTPALLH